jgi:hypothetical protein
LTIQVSPIIRDALASVKPGEDLDEALLRALKARHPEQAATLLSALTRVIEVEGRRTGEDREVTVRRLAGVEPGPKITLRTSGGPAPTTRMSSQVIRIGDKEYHSLDEVPPHLRRLLERGESPGRMGPRTGCTWALLGGWLIALTRSLWR